LKSNLDKFVNLGFKFSRRDPHLENAKFDRKTNKVKA